ncbi:cytochrome P450 [Leucogyrophana mollusca]|uniref:Cytochrome P450 n=1 Tax=Leucogyrophana mollusca TaxID=85980 RepID=A0ACB8BUM8_9AGAM|nr:cytochrome P450 [Leucogyrophana mollusca]
MPSMPVDLPENLALCAAGAGFLLLWGLFRLLAVPAHLRHLPVVPIIPLIRSYVSREPDDVRIRRLILPFANQQSEGMVVVWAMGTWMIHIIDPKLCAQVVGSTTAFKKSVPGEGSMFWRFVGASNIVMANGEQWKKQSQILRQAFNAPIPIDLFTSLARNAFEVMEAAGTGTRVVRWCDLAQRFALDAVGTSIVGFNYDAIRTDSPFVKDYNSFMHNVASPLYLAFPLLERIFPRPNVVSQMENLISGFERDLEAKRANPGDGDIMTFMVKHPDISAKELRDNMATLFIAGHDTTSGAIASLVYFLAVNQHMQHRVREEVLSTLGPTADPSLSTLSPQSLPYLNACIREVLRINPPASYITPRISSEGVTLGKYYVPAGTLLICNIFAVHHSDAVWGDPDIFRPERFLDDENKAGARAKVPLIPFSSGPRQCPAQNFAMYEMRALAAMLLREYDWVLPESSIHADGVKNAFSPFALTLPYDLDVEFHKRTPVA